MKIMMDFVHVLYLIWLVTIGYHNAHGWLCQAPVWRVYCKLETECVLRFNIAANMQHSSVFSIVFYDGSPYGSVAFLNGQIYQDSKPGTNITGNMSGNLYLTVFKVQMSNAGTYRVDSITELQQCICLYVTGVPNKPTISNDKDPSVGESATMTCTSTSTTYPTNHSLSMSYDWIMDGVENPAGDRYKYSPSRNMLTISGIIKEDSSKRFACRSTEVVNNGYASPWSNQSSFYVKYGPENVRFNPAVTSYEKIENTLLPDVNCEADCNPTCRFNWMKVENGVTLTNSSSLQLGILTRHKAGTYRCLATRSGSGSATEDLTLIILYAPKVSISLLPTTVTQNSEFKIFCEANDGFPAVYKYKGFVHSYNGNTIPTNAPSVLGTPQNSSLHILSARLQDTGTYTCFVSNDINNTGILYQRASVTISIKDTPSIHLDDTMFYGSFNETVNVKIPVYSFPECHNFTITKSDGSAIQNSSKYNLSITREPVKSSFHSTKVFLNGTIIHFTIHSFSPEDLASYVLVISNEVGYSSTEILVTRKSSPLPPSYFKVSMFQNGLSFSWESSSNGGDRQSFLVQTSLDGTDIWHNQTLFQEYENEHKTYGQQYVVNVTNLPNGVYRCRLWALNSIGYAEAVYLPGYIQPLYQSNGIGNESMWNQQTLVVGLVLGLVIIGLVISEITILYKMRKMSSKKDDISSAKNAQDNTERHTYSNVTYTENSFDDRGSATFRQDTNESLNSLDEQYTRLNDRPKSDIDAYDAITPDNKIMV